MQVQDLLKEQVFLLLICDTLSLHCIYGSAVSACCLGQVIRVYYQITELRGAGTHRNEQHLYESAVFFSHNNKTILKFSFLKTDVAVPFLTIIFVFHVLYWLQYLPFDFRIG